MSKLYRPSTPALILPDRRIMRSEDLSMQMMQSGIMQALAASSAPAGWGSNSPTVGTDGHNTAFQATYYSGAGSVLSNGNKKVTYASYGAQQGEYGKLGSYFTSGAGLYFEYRIDAINGSTPNVGIAPRANFGYQIGTANNDAAGYRSDGVISALSGGVGSGFATFAAGDFIGVKFNSDNSGGSGTISFYKNGTLIAGAAKPGYLDPTKMFYPATCDGAGGGTNTALTLNIAGPFFNSAMNSIAWGNA